MSTRVLSTLDDNSPINCLFHVLKFLCLNNRKKLQCTGHRRNCSVGSVAANLMSCNINTEIQRESENPDGLVPTTVPQNRR